MSSSSAAGDMVFNNNTITLSQGSTGLANCIHVAQKGTSVHINNNTFTYNAFASTTASYMIYCSNSTPDVTVTGNSTSGTITKTGIGPFDGYYNYGSPASGTAVISDNNFSNIVLTGSSVFYGIRQYTSINQVELIQSNVVSSITGGTSPVYGILQGYGAAGSAVDNNTVVDFTSSGAIYGIVLGSNIAPVTLDAHNNKVSGLHTSGTSVYGIQNLLGTNNHIGSNKICDLQSSNSNGVVTGILLSGGANTHVYNNYITGLECPNTNAANNLTGINVAGGTNVNLFFNTVNLYGLSSGALFGSSAVNASTSVNLDMRNNILVNKSTPNGGGFTVVYRRSSTVLGTYLITSDANDLFTWNTTAQYLVFYDGTNADATLAAYQLRVGPTRDANSFSEDPPLEGSPPPCNPHMLTTVPTLCESGGVQVSTPIVVNNDIDGDTRALNPDVGADEFSGIAAGLINPGGVAAIPITAEQIDITFTPNPANNPVVIVWNNTGSFTPPSGPPPLPGSPFAGGIMLYQGHSSPVSHTGLLSNTTYYYRAYSYNGVDYSIGVLAQATTPCAPYLLPLTEGFNTADPAQNPVCWSQQQVAGNYLVTYQTSTTNPTTTPYEGPRFAWWNSYNIPAGNQTRLVSPPLTTVGTLSVDVSFYWYNENSTSYNSGVYLLEGVQVQFSFDGILWGDAGPFVPRYDATLPSGTGAWKLKTIHLPLAAGNSSTLYVGFLFTSRFGRNCSMDQVTVHASPDIITGVVADSLGVPPPESNMFIFAHGRCNPDDSLSTLSGGISYFVDNTGVGRYVVYCNDFLMPPVAGDLVPVSFHNMVTEEFETEMVPLELTGGATVFNPVVRLGRSVHLPSKTTWVRVVIPPHKTLQIHYTFVDGCGNTDVFEWNGQRWIKFRQWNWNNYCTWRYIQNNTNRPKVYVIHNDNGNIRMKLMFNCPFNPGTSLSNYSAFALFNMGWHDRPYSSCEFGNIVGPYHLFVDYEGAFLDNFPSRLGFNGVENLEIQFESYDNMFWNDMQLMLELSEVTMPGMVSLTVPDAMIPFNVAMINPGDTVVYFNTGGIMVPGPHTMTLSATAGVSVGIEGMLYTTLVPIPAIPSVTTAPVTDITSTSALGGGNVTDEGGAPVTARGVCWSLLPEPTVNDSHTNDGTGPGMFTSTYGPLLPSTIYHGRAYATNLAGTAYGQEIIFETLPEERVITGVVYDEGGMPVPDAALYMIAHRPCNPEDTLTIANGGITLGGGGGGGMGEYTVHCGSFQDPPEPGELVFMSSFNTSTLAFDPEAIRIGINPVNTYHPVVNLVTSVYLDKNSNYTTVDIPPNRTLKVHITDAYGGCGNLEVFRWNGSSWVSYRTWNFNQYCTWKYIRNDGTSTMKIKIHNATSPSNHISFDMFVSSDYYATSSSNSYTFAQVGNGWRDRPYTSCEFGTIQAQTWSFADVEGASLSDLPSGLGANGVENLTIHFESYNNMFWNDMELVLDLAYVSTPGTLIVNIPDAQTPVTSAYISSTDTICRIPTGGILFPDLHSMTLSASGGLSIGIDAYNYSTLVPTPQLPTVSTLPVSDITSNSAMSGGDVTSEGGAPVTARGVCWCTNPNPTILCDHTVDGSGLGQYSSTMAPLMPNTVYFVRAYATNLAGTAYGEELSFVTLPPEILIAGTVYDTTGMPVPSENLYIVAYNRCNPDDSLTTLNGGITLAPGGQYTVHCNNFIEPPLPGQPVIMSFFDIFTECFAPETVILQPDPVTWFSPVVRIAYNVHLPYKTSYVRVVIPPHKTLQIHYTFVDGCGNTDVFEWTGTRWTKFRQWNWNHYCTWRYIQNNTNRPKIYVIHNDNGNIRFKMMFNCPFNPGTSLSNYSEFALFNMGWRDRPLSSCEFGDLIGFNHTFIDYEGASLDNFPQRLGTGGVQSLTIQFESYPNQFWSDMQLMVELEGITQPGMLELHCPDAMIPYTMAVVNPSDTACFFNTGGILFPGVHTMTLTATGGLSMGMDGMIYTTLMPIPDLPTVLTAPVTDITTNSATGGGNVTGEGGAPVAARGVCWSMLPEPTINDPHTNDGTGPGMFTSIYGPLMPSTTYHGRAYATNLAGTAYGDELVFTTLSEIPEVRWLQNITIGPGQTACYDAMITIITGDPYAGGAGGPPAYFTYVEPTGDLTLVSGGNILMYPHTWAMNGSHLHAYIDLSGNYCPQTDLPEVAAKNPEYVIAAYELAHFRLYPNPTTGNFTLELKGTNLRSDFRVEVYSMRGERVLNTMVAGESKAEIQFSGMPEGLYFVTLKTNDYIETIKLVKTR
jgi:hypothetical protein